MTLDYIKSLVELAAAVAVLFAGAAYGISMFFIKKKAGVKNDLETENETTTWMMNQIETYKKIIKDYDERNTAKDKENDKKFKELSEQIVAFKASIEEKDKTIQKYLDILQNRNPELTKFIEESRIRQESQLEIAKRTEEFMSKINMHMQDQKKDLRIEATVTKQ